MEFVLVSRDFFDSPDNSSIFTTFFSELSTLLWLMLLLQILLLLLLELVEADFEAKNALLEVVVEEDAAALLLFSNGIVSEDIDIAWNVEIGPLFWSWSLTLKNNKTKKMCREIQIGSFMYLFFSYLFY